MKRRRTNKHYDIYQENFFTLLVFSKNYISKIRLYSKAVNSTKAHGQKQIDILNTLDCMTPVEEQATTERWLKLKSNIEDLLNIIQKYLKEFFQIKISKMKGTKESLLKKVKSAEQLATRKYIIEAVQRI